MATEKDLKKLSRMELVDILCRQREMIDELGEQNRQLEARARDAEKRCVQYENRQREEAGRREDDDDLRAQMRRVLERIDCMSGAIAHCGEADRRIEAAKVQADEILSPDLPHLDPLLDPKCAWALNHLEQFPVEVNTADYRTLLRVPGIGVMSARRILAARQWRSLDLDALKKLGVVLKRAQYFITCSGRMTPGLRVRPEGVRRALTALEAPALAPQYEQLYIANF